MKSQKSNYSLIIFLLVLVLSLYITNEYTITQRKVYIKISKENLENIEATERITYNFSSSEISKLKSQSKSHLKESKESSNQFLNLPIKKSIMVDRDTPITNFKVTSKNPNFKANLSGNIKSFAKHDQNVIIPLKQYAVEISPDSSLKSKDYKFELEYTYNLDYQPAPAENKDNSDRALRKSKKNKDKENNNANKLKESNIGIISEDSRRLLTIPLSTFDEAKEIESNAELVLQFDGFKNGIKLEENDKEDKVFSSSTKKNDVIEYKINLKLLNNSNKNINIKFNENQESPNESNDNSKNKDNNSLSQNKQEHKFNTRHKQPDPNSNQPNPPTGNSSNGPSTNGTSTDQQSSSSPITYVLTIIYLIVLLFFSILCFCFSSTAKEFGKDDNTGSNNVNNNNIASNNNNADPTSNKDGNFNADAGEHLNS